MEKDYRVFTVRRLFKEDMKEIQQYGMFYNQLYFNPFTEDYIWQIMLQGAFWAVYDGGKNVALTYILPADSPAFTSFDASWHMKDLLGCSLENSLLCGYVWVADEYKDRDFYSPIVKLWHQQATRRGRQLLIHYMPFTLCLDVENLLHNGFDLVGLRGLDNLVPHLIFTKPAGFSNRNIGAYGDIETVPFADTKTVSMLCEKGYRGFDMDVEKNILLGR